MYKSAYLAWMAAERKHGIASALMIHKLESHSIMLPNFKKILSSPSPFRQTLTLGCVLAISSTAVWVQASDHVDFPKDVQSTGAIGDPVSDLTDLYAFKSPENSENLVLVMNSNNSANSMSNFSNKVQYSFRMRPSEVHGTAVISAENGEKVVTYSKNIVTKDVEYTIVCSPDDSEKNMLCDFANAADPKVSLGSASVAISHKVGDVPVSESEGIRLFAGLRHDPFFIDAIGARVTLLPVEAGRYQERAYFKVPKEQKIVFPRSQESAAIAPLNSMTPYDVMSIVVEFNPQSVFGTDKNTMFSIVAETSSL